MLLNNGGLRLMGMLATTRAIGDHDLQPYGLTPEPEVMHLPRTPEDEFLVGWGGGGGGRGVHRGPLGSGGGRRLCSLRAGSGW
jgi:hypothetical protein